MDIRLKQASGLLDWMQVYRLYRRALPRSERKPFSIVVKMAGSGKTDVWCLRNGGRFAGFATTINSEEAVLLDYLAVADRLRGKGAGHCALRTMMEHYAPRGMFVEIESPFEPGDDQKERVRRKQFYRSCGMEPFGVMANVFGVKMELLGRGCCMNFAEYQDFYRTHYNPWAAEHLSEVPYPTEK